MSPPSSSIIAAVLVAVVAAPGLLVSVPAQSPGVEFESQRLPGGLEGTSAVWAGGKGYIFGGNQGGNLVINVMKFTPGQGGSPENVAQLPDIITESTAIYTGSAAYVFGGKKSSGFANPTKDIVKFDPATNRASLIGATLPVGVAGAASVWTGSKAYIFGGYGQFGEVSRRIFEFDPASQSITTKSAQFEKGTSYASAVWDGTYAYIFGGLFFSSSSSGSEEAYTKIWRYDPSSDTLAVSAATLPFPSNAASAVYDGKKAYILGGAKDVQGTGQDTIFEYDPATDKVSIVPQPLLLGVGYASAVWGDGAAYLFGGRNGNTREDRIQRFIPGTSTASALPTFGGAGLPADTMSVGVRGRVLGPGGTGVSGIPVILLQLTSGLLRPVGGGVTQSDGSYDLQKASAQPSHVATYQDGHIVLRPLDATKTDQDVAPMEVSRAGQPVTLEDLLLLRSSVEEARVFDVGNLTSGSLKTVTLGGYHGLDRFELDATGSGLQLIVAKLKNKGLPSIPEPRGDVQRWFGMSLIDSTGAEVSVNEAHMFFTAPTGTKANATLILYHLIVKDSDTAWESTAAGPDSGGLYGVNLASLSLFAIGPKSGPVAINPVFFLAGGGVLLVGLVGAAGLRLRAKRARAPRAATAPVARPTNLPTASVPIKEKEFLVAGVSFKAGGKKLLQDLSFGFQHGQILALLGPSGSGKSTLLKCIIGENSFDGEINAFGYRPGRDTDALKRLIGYVPQETQLYPDMTVQENVAYFGKQYGLSKAQIESVVPFLLQTVGLEDRATTAVKVLSGGQQRRASLAATLAASPALLILDEPTSGLDPITRRNLWKFIRQANRELGISVIVTTHFLDETEFSDRVVILVRGKVAAAGTPQELLRSLPGGGKVVVVELQNTSPAIEGRIREAAAPLQKQGIVKKVDITGFTVRFFVENPQVASRNLIEALGAAEVPVKSLTAADCTMEDVFVHYAGEPWKEPGT